MAVGSPTLARPVPAAPAPSLPADHRGRRAIAALVAVAVGLAALVLVLWARTRPGFDPYGWLVWGHQTLAGNLDTNAAPSWKPLPYLFTVPFALAGHLQVGLWMVGSVAVSLSGVVFAARIAYRLTDAPPQRRYAAFAAGAFAGVALLGITDYSHYVLSAQSDPMIVSLCLGAIDAHLSGRPRAAFVLGVLGSLGRPEVWPFLGLYSVWCWLRVPRVRPLVVVGMVVLAAFWFGIPALTARSPFVAGSNALGSGRALHSNRVWGTVQRFLDLHAAALETAALLAVAWAVWRRERAVLVLAAGVVVWVIVEIAFALHGWPGLPRYMFEAAGVTVVLAGVLVGRLLGGDLPMPSWLSAALAVVLVGVLVPTAVSRVRVEHQDLRVQRARTDQVGSLASTIRRLGAAATVRGCGEAVTHLEWQTILAWNLQVNVSKIGFKYGPAIHSGRPIVLFTPTPKGGWRVRALHQQSAACRALARRA